MRRQLHVRRFRNFVSGQMVRLCPHGTGRSAGSGSSREGRLPGERKRRGLGWWRGKEQAEVPGGEHPMACVEGVTRMGLRVMEAPRVRLGKARGEGLGMAS